MKARVIPRHRLELELDDQTIWSCICLLEEIPLTTIAQCDDLGWQVRPDGTAIAYPCGTRSQHRGVRCSRRRARRPHPLFCVGACEV